MRTASREEWCGRVTDDCIDGCGPGGALLGAGFQDWHGEEEQRKVTADASWRGCRAGGLWRELKDGGDWLN